MNKFFKIFSIFILLCSSLLSMEDFDICGSCRGSNLYVTKMLSREVIGCSDCGDEVFLEELLRRMIPINTVKSLLNTNTSILTGILYVLHHKELDLPVTYDGRISHDGSTLVLRDWPDYKDGGQRRNSTLFALQPCSDPLYYTLYHIELRLPVTYDGRVSHDGSTLVLRDWVDYKAGAQWRNSTLFALESSLDPLYYTLYHKELGLPVTYDGKISQDGSALVLRDWPYYKSGEQWRNSTLFSFIPANYKISAVIEDFEYQESDINNLLKFSATQMPIASDLIIHNQADIMINKKIENQVTKQENISWNLIKSDATNFSHNLFLSIMAKAPFLGDKWGGNIGYQFVHDTTKELEENNTKLRDQTIEYILSETYTIPPKKNVKISQLVDWIENVTIPFSAKIKFTAKADRLNVDGSISSMADVDSEVVKYLLKHEGYEAPLNQVDNIVYALINGTFTANCSLKAFINGTFTANCSLKDYSKLDVLH